MGGVSHFFEPESKLGFGGNKKKHLCTHHFLLPLFTKEDECYNTVLYKRRSLGDLRWAGFGYIPWEREVLFLVQYKKCHW